MAEIETGSEQPHPEAEAEATTDTGTATETAQDAIEPAAENESPAEALPSMPLIEHLREFRTRLIYAVLAVVGAMLLSLTVANPVKNGLMEMCTVCQFEYHRPTEGVITWFRVALILGFALASPVVLYQIVAYVLPALHRRERRYLFLTLPGAGLLFALGLVFGYAVVVPRSINFLATWGMGMSPDAALGGEGALVPDGTLANPNWNVALYISFVTNLLLIIGVAFQTPLVVYLLSKIGVIKPKIMAKYRRHAIVVFAVLAAVLTPTPDPFTMFVVLAPMYLLYELGLILARIF